MTAVKREWTREEWNSTLAALDAPTSDDVWITRDGRRLDTPDAVIEFMRAYTEQRERDAPTHGAGSRAR